MENYLEIIAVVISNLTTFYLSRKIISKSNRREILYDQLIKIYKPIAIFLKYEYSFNFLDTRGLNSLYNFVHSIIIENHELIPEEMFDHESRIHNLKSTKEDMAELYFRSFEDYIYECYESTKGKLNYPNNSIRNRWPFMNKWDKVNFAFNVFIIPIFVFFTFSSLILIAFDFVFSIILNDPSISSQVLTNPTIFFSVVIPALAFTVYIYKKDK